MMQQAAGEALGLRFWPFAVVPDGSQELTWADRATLGRQTDRLMRNWSRHSVSSLNLLWADFGAGKTHTLLCMRQRAVKDSAKVIVPIYTTLPKASKTFLDIYRAVARAIPEELLRELYAKAAAAGWGPASGRSWPPVMNCFKSIGIGGEAQRQLSYRWLQGEPLSRRELGLVGGASRIRSTDDAVLALSGIVELVLSAGYRRMLLMLDEFQRVETLRRAKQDEINAGLHGFFNACPKGLTLLLSFSFGVEHNINHFLNAELLSRADPHRLSIPTMSSEDAMTFVEDLLTSASDDGLPGVIEVDAIRLIISSLEARMPLTPRRLMKAFGSVLTDAELDLEDKRIERVDGSYAEQVMRETNLIEALERESESG